MKQLMRNLKLMLIFFLVLSLALLAGLVIQQYRSKNILYVAAGENKAALRDRYAQAGSIYSADGVALATSQSGERTYAKDKTLAQATLHVVGDYTHNIDNTIEARYQAELMGSDRNILHQFALDFVGKGLLGDDVHLTLDSRISKRAYQLLSGKRGAIVLLNYQTGAIMASVSAPSTSPESVIAFKGFPDTSLFNRAIRGSYAPGSTFKVVTTAAFMESSGFNPELVVDCKGKSTVAPDGADESDSGHGKVNLASAFSRSCNVYFGQIGADLGPDALTAAATRLGWLDLITVDRLNASRAKMFAPNDRTALTWLAIGQPSGESQLAVSPLQLAMLAGAIGNGGVMQQARIIDHLRDPMGRNYQTLKPEPLKTVMSTEEAKAIEKLMIATVASGTGTSARVSGTTIAGKTGTVEVEGQKNNALFIGYVADPKHPYAIAVVVEEGGSGGSAAAPLAAQLLRTALSLE